MKGDSEKNVPNKILKKIHACTQTRTRTHLIWKLSITFERTSEGCNLPKSSCNVILSLQECETKAFEFGMPQGWGGVELVGPGPSPHSIEGPCQKLVGPNFSATNFGGNIFFPFLYACPALPGNGQIAMVIMEGAAHCRYRLPPWHRSKYNAKPFMIRTTSSFYTGDNYYEIDIDIHNFGKTARIGLYGCSEVATQVHSHLLLVKPMTPSCQLHFLRTPKTQF